LTAGDFQPLVEQAKSGDVILCDPPYHDGFAAYTKEGFDEHDQYDLAEFCRQAADRGAAVIAFNKDCEYIREIWSWSTIMSIAESRAINSNGKGRGRVGCVLATNAPELIDG
jgi:DNA adenine methylase